MRKRILLVEDDEDIRTAMKDILTMNNFDVLEAPDADEGLATLAEEKIDLVILDIMMPGMPVKDFVELEQKARIIYCSALPPEEAEKRIYRDARNIWGYIQKPFEMDDLIAEVNRVFS